ncbi:ATP-binding protein [uncultured Pontibacter sp.]|uniref:PAS domain-containing sensor histidine kinase n=1 Tax=uncultured Pontibacter sp. TaxID=453356 RepID=UPI00260A7E80|nr:ATP-binding protein [uncultured Pontibacter sp.]
MIQNSETLNIFRGGGQMGALMQSYDWESHPLGDPLYWPESLKNNIRLMLNSNFPMFIWWSKELYMFHNDAYLPALGKKHPKALGASARDMWSEIWDDIGGIVENILQRGEPFYAQDMLLYLERKGFAEETYWTFSYSPAFADSGEINGVFCACNEETSSVLTQRRLKTLKDVSDALAQVKTMEQLAETACSILSQNTYDLPFNLIYFCNSVGSAAILGGTSGNVADTLAPAVIDFTSADAVWPFAQILETRQPMYLRLSGAAAEVVSDDSVPDAVIWPIFKPSEDSIVGFYVSGISPRQEYDEDYKGFHSLLTGHIATSIASVKARQEILKRQEYLNEIFQQAPVGITMLRGSNYIVDIANPGVCEIWRVNQEETIGKPILEVVPEAKEQGFLALLDGVLHTGVPFVANEQPLVLERNGQQETVYLNFVYHPLRDEQGFVTGVIAVAIEITEQVKARKEIESINKELLATNADLDNFVYSASHDLKAPIHNIEGLVDELKEYLPEEVLASEEVQQLTSYINNSIERFKKVVVDLTKVAKIQREAGVEIAKLDLNSIIEEVCLDFKPDITAAEATVKTDLAADATIYFSAKNLRSIVYNLISNALKYTSPDRAPHIAIATESTPTHLGITVTDNGLGLRETDIDKIFTMFKRLHDHVEGSGIGLYIVKRIIENAGGTIEVKTELDKGTTFRVQLPK